MTVHEYETALAAIQRVEEILDKHADSEWARMPETQQIRDAIADIDTLTGGAGAVDRMSDMDPAETLREKLIYFLEYAPHMQDKPAEERRAACARMVDGYAHELAERQRAHPVYSDSEATWHRHVLYGFAGESFKAQEELDALTEAIVKSLANSIDPEVAP
jgi:hypothetical protein